MAAETANELPGGPGGGAVGKPAGSVAVATALVVVSACCFGSNSILALVAIHAGVPMLSVLFWRYILAVPMLAAVAVLSGARLALPRQRLVPLLTLGGGGQALVLFLAMTSLQWISAATLGFLFYTYPAWVALLAAVRGREPIDARRGFALALSLGGIALMIGAPGAAALHPAGVACALGAAVVYALFIPMIGRLQAGLDPAVASAWVVLSASALFALAALGTGDFRWCLPLVAWESVIALALLATTLGFLSFLRGLAVLGPVRTAIVSTVEPFWIALLALAVLAQPLTLPVLGGGALIAAAVVLLQRGASRG